MILLKLHNRIRRVRVEKGFSQAEVCKGIISASHYSNFENGRYQLGTDINSHCWQSVCQCPILIFPIGTKTINQ